ncbi:tetrapyrrole biosynthesis, uroporphyrinogen III synthase [Halteromyces radiatus]|uniref:tetrapyrrole biosynthesis, uroporphyrinogen III synthase n=1 Tax=Halteromyces radiatus TaxID=101107 RepID=UPI0022202679|nr:tetrapyrrole biosynthesis, uroporphyrinogen III synthase [Halteromyces radiatus]KAI8082885.1 tetrapyrrole biosynthesis, uroporphyrinogen III synthase [Halteromyces radiatus]
MRLFFFKAHTEEYQKQTELYGYEPHFIPVLDQIYTTDELISVLKQTPSSLGIHGIIITSQRSIQTLKQVNLTLDQQQRQAWQGIPLYIVGDNTAKKLEQTLDQQLFFLPDQPRPLILTADNASCLADQLIQQQQQQQKGLLFLAGDKRRDELPNRLTQAGYHLHYIQTYRTCRHADLATHLINYQQHKIDMDKQSKNIIKEDDWSIYFSPSGADYILSLQSSLWHTKIAAIGHTTANHLKHLGYTVHAIATKPDISHLLEAITLYDRNISHH